MTPLGGLDGLLLSLETPATPMHIGALHLCDLPRGYRGDFAARVRDAMAERLQVAPVFHRRLARMPVGFANPMWIEASPDLAFHVRCLRIDPPGDLRALLARVATLHEQLLDRNRPLWMLYVFDGLDGIAPRAPAQAVRAFYLKAHHAALDGAAGAALGDMLFDRTARPRRRIHAPAGGAAPESLAPATARRARDDRAPGGAALAAAALAHSVREAARLAPRLPAVAATLARMLLTPQGGGRQRTTSRLTLGPRTLLNRTITSGRSYAAESIPLAEVRAIAAATDTTVNDVVLALCSDTLRRYLRRHDDLPERTLIATMPISLRAPGDTEFTTRATLSLVELATDVADPRRRLRRIHASAAATKSLVRGEHALVPTDFPSIGLPWLLAAVARLYGASGICDAVTPLANVVISNIPGPKKPLYFAGARLRTYWPLSIVEHGLGLNVTVISYADALEFGFVTAACAIPDATELARDLEAAFSRLRRVSA